MAVPPLLARRSSDEYRPLPWGEADLRALERVRGRVDLTGRRVTAATLRAIDAEHGGGFYEVPVDAEHDERAADDAFASRGPVIDVQTHCVAPSRWGHGGAALSGFLQMVDPERWHGDIDPHRIAAGEWAATVFGGSETTVALLTALPGQPDTMVMPNDEIAAARDIVDRYAGSGRVLTHTIVHPNLGAPELERMHVWSAELRPSAWKVYTLWGPPETGGVGFYLDDATFGIPFLEHVREVGPRIVCAHKGIAGPVPDATPAAASPRDIGPVAAFFPDLQFVVYHSGYDVDAEVEEGPYAESGRGVNRLVRSLLESGIEAGANVWAELGSTWFLMLRRPSEAAHVIGKLLRAVGPNRILWGTDSVWYGPPQPLIDAFRTFTIPERMQVEFGYPALTPEIKQCILADNAVELYGIDTPTARDGDLPWLREAAAELTRRIR